MAEVRAVFPERKLIQTSIGKAEYDYLVFAAGTTSNFLETNILKPKQCQ